MIAPSPVFFSSSCWSSNTLPQTCHEAALFYAHKGIPVFPCSGKIPFRGTQGHKDATVDPERIGWWWRRWPHANVAAPTGAPSGWVVLDVDGHHGGFTSSQQLQMLGEEYRRQGKQGQREEIPMTRMTRTGSGVHLFFQAPLQIEMRNTVEFAGLRGIDLRGQGGYVVLPPSRHPNGRHYRWLSLLPPAPFPPRLCEVKEQHDRLRRHLPAKPSIITQFTHSHLQEDPEYWLEKALAHAVVGKRHTCALWLSCRLIEHAHLTPAQAEVYLRSYINQVPGDDYPLSDALNCLRWASAHVTTRR